MMAARVCHPEPGEGSRCKRRARCDGPALAVTLLTIALIGPAAASAAAPEVKHLYPSGATRGTTTSVDIVGKPGDQRLFVWCSRADVEVVPSAEAGKLKVTAPPDAAPGVCWIRFYNFDGASALRPFMIGLQSEALEAEPNNQLTQAQRFEQGTIVVNGRLDSSEDVDVFAVPLAAGQTFVASMNAYRPLGSPMDGVLQVLSEGGFVLEQNDDDQEFDPRVVFTAPADGTYLVRTFAFPAKPNQSIRFHSSAEYIYRLTLTTGPFVDHTWPLAVSASEPRLRLEGWGLGDRFGDVALVVSPDEQTASYFDPQLANTAEVPVLPHPVVVEPSAEEPPTNYQLPAGISGRLSEPGEIDEYTFSATKGQKLLLKVQSREIGHPLDPVLVLRGSDGKVLAEADDASRGIEDVTLNHKVGADGDYRLQVFDRFSAGGFRYVYLLTAQVAEPTATLTVAADAYTLAEDKPLEIEVKVDRQHGFKDELAITAVDLPAGVNVQPVTSAAEGDSSKSIKLVLEAREGVERPGTFRIIGTTAGDAPLEFVASVTLADFDAQLDRLWLNVPNPRLPKHPVEARRPE